MRRRIAALLMVVGLMLATVAPVLAQEETLGPGACDQNPGFGEGSSAPIGTPPQLEPGASRRNTEADEHDDETGTRRGELSEDESCSDGSGTPDRRTSAEAWPPGHYK